MKNTEIIAEFKSLRAEFRKLRKEVNEFITTDPTICTRCGFTWGEHRGADNACVDHQEPSGLNVYNEGKFFKPMGS